MISILILTLNEEQNLPACLEAVRWCDDILVLDSFSSDRTVEIAKAAGVRVLQRQFEDFASQRNFGLREGGLKHDWVLHLDADEVVSPELHAEAVAAAQVQGIDAFRIASRMMFHGRWLKHSGLYPSYQVRLGRRDRLSFSQVGHGQRESLSPDRIGTLRHPLVHHSFAKGLHEWMDKHNRYSTAEANHFFALGSNRPSDWTGLLSHDAVRRRRALKDLSGRLPCRPLFRFLYMFIWRAGVLDGAAGFHYCRLLAIYEYLTVLKTRELERRRQGLPV
jgi:glycosyltransferase involved in cell wall biosynthesis